MAIKAEDENLFNSALTLSNAVELGVHLVEEVMGGDVANSLNGDTVTGATLRGMIASRINQKLNAAA